nr:MAG TPA: GIY-YIG nuclease superfamily protein [Caudoviricetes sp.]
MKMRTSGIYGLVVKSTGELYVGKTYDIAKRWSHYSSKLKNSDHEYEQIQNAYNNDDLGWVILEEVSDNEELLVERENWWFKNSEKMGYILINKETESKAKSRVEDTSNMCKAQRGAKNGNARLKEEDVIEIKKMLLLGVKRKDIANKFEVSNTLINNIANGNRWASVEI